MRRTAAGGALLTAAGLGAAIGAALLLGCRLPDTSEQSSLMGALERKSGKIVYLGADYNVWVANQAGGARVPITEDAARTQDAARIYQMPIWSPDGARVAFVGIDVFQGGVAGRVLTARADGSQAQAYSTGGRLPVNFVPGLDHPALAWSPDGRQLSFLTAGPGGGGFLLLNWQPGAAAPVQILDAGRPLFWSWAPDSTGVAVHAGSVRSPSSRVAFVRAGTPVMESGLLGQARAAGARALPGEFQTPAWVPDGSGVLLATAADDGGTDLVVVHPEQRNRGRLIATTRGAVAFLWSPDSESIGYLTSREEGESIVSRLHLRQVATGTEATLEEDGVIAFFWSPDSASVAYFVPSVISRNEGSDQALVLTLRVYDRERRSSVDIETFVPTPQFAAVMRAFDQYGQAARIWSPDSRNVVYAAVTDAGPYVMVARAAGNLVPRKMAPGLIGFWSWQ